MEVNEKVLLLLFDYQKNHFTYYDNLIQEIGSENIFLLFKDRKDDFNYVKSKKYYYSEVIKSITLLIELLIKIRRSKLIISEEFYSYHFFSLFLIVFFRNKSLLTIHNVNKWFNRGNKRGILNLIKDRVILLIINSVKGFIVISPSLKDYIKDNKLTKKRVFYFPFMKTSNLDVNKKHEDSNRVIFTIPGSVNAHRRNYYIFLNALLKLLNEGVSNIKFNFLGRIVYLGDEEKKLIEEIQQVNDSTIAVWDEYVDDDTFNKTIIESSYLIGNINVNYSENLIKEYYGRSKETGVVFIMMKYQKILLMPRSYESNSLFSENIIFYEENNESVYLLLKDLMNKQQKFNFDFYNNHDILIKKQVKKIKSLFSE